MKYNYFNNIVKIEVTGKNIDNYIKKIIKSKINIIKLKKINHKKIHLYLYYEDYLKIKEFKTIYEIKLIAKLGRFKIKKFLKKNSILLLILILAIIILYGLSNIILKIEVIHSNPSIRNLIYDELKKYGIKEFKLKKNYKELQTIKQKILSNNKDNIEWIEIIENGTKYTIRLEERKKNKEQIKQEYQNIVANKNAILTSIIAISGEKVKFENDYVNKGDIIITGNLLKPDNSSILLQAKGTVYGEVWYKVDVEYPYIYKEEKPTGKTKQVLVFNFLNKRLSLFDFNKYNTFKAKKNIIFANNMLPINLEIQKQYELNIIDDFLTDEETIDKAIIKAKSKLLNNNNKIKEIKEVKIIEKNYLTSKIKLKLFISVIEDIGIEEKINIEDINKSIINKKQ